MKKLILALIIASLPIGMGIGFFVVEFVWQPAIGANERFFVIFLIGGGVLLLTVAPLLVYEIINNRRRLSRGRAALDAGDLETAYRNVCPTLGWLTCNHLAAGNEAIELMAELYRRCNMETAIDEISHLHTRYCELYAEHKDYQGIVHDEEISDELDQMFDKCRGLVKQLPVPPEHLGK